MEDDKLEFVLRVPIKLMKMAGIWQVKGSSKLYKIYGFVLHLLGIDLFILCQIIFMLQADSLMELSDTLSVCFTYIIFSYKSWIYTFNMDTVIELFKEYNEIISLMQKIESKKLEKMDQRLQQSLTFFRVFWAMCLSSCIFGASVPITTYLMNPNPPYKIAYNLWLPVDFRNEIGWFIIVGAIDSLDPLFFCQIASAMDTIPVLCFNMCAALLEELGERISCIGSSSEDEDKTENQKLKLFEQYIDLHLKIKVLIKKTEKIFSSMIFAQGAVSLVILCTSAFMISKLSPAKDFSKFGFLIFYLVPMVLQILVPCYFGNEISLASESLSTKMFQSGWYYESKKFRIAMKLFMENTKRAIIVVSANGFFYVNLSQFLRVINLTYSVYALLQRMN